MSFHFSFVKAQMLAGSQITSSVVGATFGKFVSVREEDRPRWCAIP
jgi:hypothetical protein